MLLYTAVRNLDLIIQSAPSSQSLILEFQLPHQSESDPDHQQLEVYFNYLSLVKTSTEICLTANFYNQSTITK